MLVKLKEEEKKQENYNNKQNKPGQVVL